ncbi:conserved hypothetical protein [Gloeothece citriformis PCC 7424]|uniref:DUF2854 domain-containing protein n=1 Tax=Gloeothece citriformis (strain PCC 7424) TaxID=65393 RepID=B7KBA9_GLOC7|nr:DUF2854 domain-containing protein [Gloeothece citriformis]ACK71465.1 conserved hypothetical protein [Gloeothece citriformis PCC 7424]
MLRKISLASLGLTVGGILTIIGFIAYATGNATLNLAGLFYGVPILLGGLALKSAELKPVPYSQPVSPEIVTLREQQATPTQNQIRKDITRYRYGQEAHLDESLERLGLSPLDEERPVLETLQETSIDGAYALILEFNSPFISWDMWQEKQEKIEKFFGPGIRAQITQPDEKRIDLALITVPQPQS